MNIDSMICVAKVGDADQIAVMSRDLIEHGMSWNWRAEAVEKSIQDPNTNVAVLREEGRIRGFGIMRYLDDDAHLVLFAVAIANQRQGVGSALLRWLEAAAGIAGAQRIRVEARRENAAARCFYNEHGYHEVKLEPGMYRKKLDGIRLEKWLRSTS